MSCRWGSTPAHACRGRRTYLLCRGRLGPGRASPSLAIRRSSDDQVGRADRMAGLLPAVWG